MSLFRGKILVIRGGAIGDFILTLPAIRALRQQFPEACLEVLGYPHIAQLAIAGGLVDRVQSIEAGPLAGFFARRGKLAEHLVDYFSEFDLIVSYLYDPDGIFKTNVGLCTKAQFIEGPHRPNENGGLHAARTYLKPLERLAIFEADPVPQLTIGTKGSGLGRLAVHPGSGGERKNWPEENWARLLEHLLNSSQIDLLMVGGEAEGEKLQRLAAALMPTRVRVAQSLPLADLAALLAQCRGFIGHDSGISHLAAAVGLPGLILWGETEVEIWRPASEKMVILKNETGLENLPAQEVLKSLKKLGIE